MFKFLSVVFLIYVWETSGTKFEPNWESLDTRPLPAWYDEAKLGIFIHWGVFSVPSFGSEWFWNDWKDKDEKYVNFMKKNYAPSFTYQEFAKDFKAEFFNATEWAELFAKSGARYIVLTSKHHEGYTLWPSKYAYSWNAKDIGPGRDLVGELGKAVRKHNLTYGLYHSLYEWFNPMYLSDKASNFTKREFVTKKIIPEMQELIRTYKPAVLWSDGDWEAYDTYWNSTGFLAWLYNESPVKDYVVVNDRWGIDIPCKHGDFYSCADRYNPGVLQQHKWENAMTIDKVSWGFRRNAVLSDYFTILELLSELVSTVSCGGNLLMNIGPTKEGTIAPIFQERLLQMGQWLSVNGESIYGTTPHKIQNDTTSDGVWYTKKDGAVYAIALFWPKDNTLVLGGIMDIFKIVEPKITLLGNEEDGPLKWTLDRNHVMIRFPDKSIVKSEWAYVLKITPVSANDIF
ncbi:plasma alpha-L-fucosidase-like [Leptinotarsa decemlineata]|uniref:plasma alpha-L-fucosidase-like n=1 Tax=Leptinotarsa decemlineata TaxID=7539 RepID=UPI003D30BAD8